jgi:CubicO group peptidase (beta-lactamase class C family)
MGPLSAALVMTPSGEVAGAGPVDRPVCVASISKALFGYAVMVAVEEGSLSLDMPCGVFGSTVRHVLAHAGGLGFTATDPTSAPGIRRIYSNHGFDLLGEVLERETAFSPGEYLRGAVFEPLGMYRSLLDGSPAKDVVSSASDLGLFAAELLDPTLVHPSTFTDFTTVQFPDLAGIVPGIGFFRPNPWGLGVEIRGTKHPHWTGSRNSIDTFGHFGGQGSFLWVDPAIRVAVVGVNDRPFGKWALVGWPRLSDHVIEHFDPGPEIRFL